MTDAPTQRADNLTRYTNVGDRPGQTGFTLFTHREGKTFQSPTVWYSTLAVHGYEQQGPGFIDDLVKTLASRATTQVSDGDRAAAMHIGSCDAANAVLRDLGGAPGGRADFSTGG